MKFKVTKKEKELYDKLQNLAEEFENNGETVLSLYALGKNLCGSVFVGESWKLTRGFYEILKKGMNKNNADDDFNTQLACSILDAISILAHEHSEESESFAKFLAEIFEHASEEWDEDEDEVELEITDENEEPKEEKEETFEQLAAKLDKMGYYVSKKPQKKDNTKKK